VADDNTDQSQKTEEPTPKKLEESRRKGQVPSSREVNHWFMILSGTVIVALIVPAMSNDLAGTMRKFLEQLHAIPTDFSHLRHVLMSLAGDVAFVILLPVVLLIAAALATGVLQSGLIFAAERIQPKLERISPLAGAKRMISMKSIAEFLKGLAKIAIVATVATMLMLPFFGGLEQLVQMEIGDVGTVLHDLATRLLIGVLSVVTLIAIADFLYQRFEYMKQMRMSRQEIKDEYKQTEGDPIVKQRLRQIRQERARQRMIAAVPGASVVITNPTHFAVALKYEFEEMNAPVMVAKGQDFVALKIREVAEENDVPIVENAPLARALYAGMEVDQEIPAEHYRAVAEIIGYVMRLKGRMPGPRR